jgi:hypothetical protein
MNGITIMRTIGRLATGLAAATLMLAGTALGTVAQSLDASSPTPDRKAAVSVTGTIPGEWNETPGDVTTLDGVTQKRGYAVSGRTVASSDPRLGGAWSYVGNSDEYPGGIVAVAGRTEIRDDDGAWGTTTEYVGERDLETVVLTGEGACAGLTAYLDLDWGTPGGPFKGIIFPGEMPEPPPAP